MPSGPLASSTSKYNIWNKSAGNQNPTLAHFNFTKTKWSRLYHGTVHDSVIFSVQQRRPPSHPRKKETRVAKTLDDEYEFAEAIKFKMLAIMFENQGRRDLSEQFSLLVALCGEKEKILRSLTSQIVFKPEKPQGKLIEWPLFGSFSVKKHAGDN
jgi:hypothetical protein